MEIFQELRFGSKWFNIRSLVGDHIFAGIFHIPQDQLWGQSWSPDGWGIFLPVGLDLGLLNGMIRCLHDIMGWTPHATLWPTSIAGWKSLMFDRQSSFLPTFDFFLPS